MGQVSILEDIQKAIENSISALESTIANPTQTQIRSQEKRLEREASRIHSAHEKILEIANLIKNDLKSPHMDAVKFLLKIESEALSLRSMREKKEKLNKEIQLLESKKLSITTKIKEIVDEYQKYDESLKSARKIIGQQKNEIAKLISENKKLTKNTR